MKDFAERVFDELQAATAAGFDGIVIDSQTGQIICQSPVRLAPHINTELMRSEIMQMLRAYEEDQLH